MGTVPLRGEWQEPFVRCLQTFVQYLPKEVCAWPSEDDTGNASTVLGNVTMGVCIRKKGNGVERSAHCADGSHPAIPFQESFVADL